MHDNTQWYKIIDNNYVSTSITTTIDTIDQKINNLESQMKKSHDRDRRLQKRYNWTHPNRRRRP